MEIAFFLVGMASLISLIVFFIMSSNISKMKGDIEKITYVVREYQKASGLGIKYTCGNCKETFVGKVDKCPHCGATNNW
jgi:rubrerythrin